MKNKFLRSLLMAADGGAGGEGGQPVQNQQNTQPGPPQIDYERIAQIVQGKQSATENSVLKGYFKQQGLSETEMNQAIEVYKQQKAASQPDANALNAQLAQAQANLAQSQLQNAAMMAAFELGLDAKTIPYVLKMADFSQVIGQDGKIGEEALKNALNKVLEDIPGLKPQVQQAAGFQIGVPGNNQQTQSAIDEQLDRIFGIKK